jgi:hypothetical protein
MNEINYDSRTIGKLTKRGNDIMIVVVRCALIVILAGILAGGGNPVPLRGGESELKAGGTLRTPGLQLSLAVDRDEVPIGEPLVVRFSTKNVAKRPLFLLESNPDTDYRFDVRDAKGNSVPLTEYGRKVLSNAEEVRLVMIKLRPGEEIRDEVHADRIVQLNVPGTYYISARRRVPEAPTNLHKLMEISSNTVRLAITAK